MEKIRLFLSSPGDVDDERRKVLAVVGQINRMLGNTHGFCLELVEWKTHVAPDMGRPQEVINRQIDNYDIFVGIMWKRFGTPTGKAESGTEEEFNIAYDNWQQFGRPRILFYFSQLPYTPKSSDETRQWGKVIDFKEKLQKNGLILEYKSLDEFPDLLREHLAKILMEWFPVQPGTPQIADFSRYLNYLNYLKAETMYIDIRGLTHGEGKPYQFGINQLYVPLMYKPGPSQAASAKFEEIPLQDALQEKKSLIIKGDPGAGKTTFLRLITFTLCQEWLGEEPSFDFVKGLWSDDHLLPVLVSIGRLAEHIRDWKTKDPVSPAFEDSPEWLLHFLTKQSMEYNWRLDRDFFFKEMDDGHCIILLDGLDEAPDPAMREKMSSLIMHLLNTYSKCRFVLTSRPGALTGEAIPLGFALVEIAPLNESTMNDFLGQWSDALYPQAPEKSRSHLEELRRVLQSRPEIRQMARTPVMLTALAVVHWNEQYLPDHRAKLYESIINWLLTARKQRPGRFNVDRCRKILQKLALAMLKHPSGRQKQVEVHWAAERLASEFDSIREYTVEEQAKFFLRDEMLDSGIIVKRGIRLEFWHLSFQEYLAAYEIGGLRENEQLKVVFEKERLYSSEWREVMLLLGGVLYNQGPSKINCLIDGIILKMPQQGSNETLPQLARKVGLLGSMVRDLSPFDFKPANPDYPKIVLRVMDIFHKTNYQIIPAQIRIEDADALGQVDDPRLQGNDLRTGSDPRTGPMVLIPSGSFWMGAQQYNDKERNFDLNAADESPVHQVKLSPFYISKYPITVGQYRRFTEDGGYKEKHYWEAGGFGQFQMPDEWADQQRYPSMPVVYVSWYEAAAYARWAEGRLPTEAEWERVARGPGQEYRKYPWGNDDPMPNSANFLESGIGKVTPVGIFPAGCSPEGVLDLAGNIQEWCRDWFNWEYYGVCAQQSIAMDPGGPVIGDYRVVRGGAFDFHQNSLRSTTRGGYEPLDRKNNVGFRMVRDFPSP